MEGGVTGQAGATGGTGRLAFLDLETTGLDVKLNEVWDIGLIVDGVEHEWHLNPQRLQRADPTALRLTRFYERTLAPDWIWSDPLNALTAVAELTEGRHLVGVVPSFDALFLSWAMRDHGLREAWHHQLIDAEVLVAGRLGGLLEPPWDSERLSRAIGVEPPAQRHEALADARWARDLYAAAVRPPALEPALGQRVALDDAWRRVEAAFPDEWRGQRQIRLLGPGRDMGHRLYSADVIDSRGDIEAGLVALSHDDPTPAVDALAGLLTNRRG